MFLRTLRRRNPDFLRAHEFPVPAWLERKSKIGVPIEVRQDN